MSVDIDATPDLLLLTQQKLCIVQYDTVVFSIKVLQQANSDTAHRKRLLGAIGGYLCLYSGCYRIMGAIHSYGAP